MKPSPPGAATPRLPDDLALQMDELAQRLLLEFPKAADRPPTLLFTSARTGEGKTTLASAVAHAMARLSGQAVLLADANPYRPRLQERFGLADSATGLFDVLRGDLAPGDALTAKAEPGQTTVLPAGAVPDATLLFRDEAINRLRELAQAYRFVVFDGGTVRLGGSSLGQHVDGVVLVIDSSNTRREVVQGGVAALRLPPGRLVGAVLNKRVQHIPRLLYRSL